MPKDICCICSRSSDAEDVLLYPVPKMRARRRRWVAVCDRNFDEDAWICEFHFNENDFRMEKNQRRLRPKALPSLNLGGDLGNIMWEYQEDENAAIMVTHTHPPSEFINEEHFDSVDVLMERFQAGTKVKPLDTPSTSSSTRKSAKSRIKKSVCRSSAAQTGMPNSRACGLIELTRNDEIYSVHCFHCVQKFTLAEINLFVAHVEQSHRILLETEDTIIDENNLKPKCSTEQTNDCADVQPVESNDKQSCLSDCNSDEEVEDYEPASPSSADEMIASKGTSTPAEYTEILFGTTDHAIVMDFLELLKAYPILWHDRKNQRQKFDKALLALTKAFNQKWPKSHTSCKATYQSLLRIKKWFKSRLHSTDKDFTGCYNKYPEYFNKCTEFLTKPLLKDEQAAFSCDLCACILAQETDLQIHKYMQHDVGELPFPCTECGRRFDSLRMLRAHIKQRHADTLAKDDKQMIMGTPSKDFKICVCDICGKCFKRKSDLDKHKLGHDEPKHVCTVCFARFVRPHSLKDHMKAHFNQRDHVCEDCGKTFVRRSNLMQHYKVHNDKSSAKV